MALTNQHFISTGPEIKECLMTVSTKPILGRQNNAGNFFHGILNALQVPRDQPQEVKNCKGIP